MASELHESGKSGSTEPSYLILLEYIFVLALILSQQTVYWVMMSDKLKKLITTGLFGSLFLMAIVSVIAIVQAKRQALPVVLFEFLWVVTLFPIVIRSLTMGKFSFFNDLYLIVFPLLLFPVAYFLIITARLKPLLQRFVNVVVVFAVISLFFWIASFAGRAANMSVTIHWGGVRAIPGYYMLYFIPQGAVHFLVFSFIRNCGVFAEAPMYSFVLSVAFIFEVFFDQRKRRNVLILILAITSFTTASTTGLIIIVLTILLTILARASLRMRSLLLIIFVPVAVIALIAILQSKTQNMGGSVSVRLEDFIAGFKSWKTAPVFGHGLEAGDDYLPYIDFGRTFYQDGNSGFSSGFMTVLMQGGAYFACLYVIIPIVSYGLQSVARLSVALLILLLVVNSIVSSSYLFSAIMILFYAVAFEAWSSGRSRSVEVD